nr:hypothetical protein B0A51_13898 [Rachicladosporium sp. CCFEE 5018]
MADPLTAIGSAAAILQLTEEAAKLGIFLCKLYKDTKHVDKTVDQLGLEVVTLGDTWTIVHIEVKKIIAVTSGASSASTSVYDSNGQLWKCICDQVQHCWNTLKELQKVVETIGVAHGNIIAQVIRQIKVDWSKEDISGIRQRVGLHMSSIQVILLLINIKIAHLAPGQASNQLLTKLSALSTMIQDMNQQKVPASNEAGLAHIHGAASLIACADEVIRSGASLWNASVAEGSVSGGFHRPERTQWTTAWLQNISALHDPEIVNSSEENSPAASVFSRSHVALFEPGNTPARGNPSISLETRQILEDDDHYLEHAMLRLGLQEGRQAVQERQWSAAYDHLKESLSLLSQLPDRSRAAYDVIELQYMLAISAFHSGEDLAIAKQALTSLTQRMPRNDKQRVIICNAKCLLARLYIRVGDLELAASSCQSASEGMRRLLGTQSDAYHEALALLVRIYELLENPRRARLVEMMIEDAPLVPQWISALSSVDQDLAADAVMKAITSKVYMQPERRETSM